MSVKQLRRQSPALLASKAVRVGIMGVCALMLVTIFNTAAFAQNDVGSIVGVATDQTGAVIPNATVIVTNEGTGESRTVSSDPSGRYTVANIPPAQYTVTATAEGFEKFVSTHNTLRSNSTVEVDTKLAVGAATQSVQVTDTAQVLQTQSATVQSVVTASQATKMELNGRNPMYLTSFIPGATGSSTLGDFNWNRTSGQNAWTINGARSQDTAVWIDGAPSNRTRDDGEITGGVGTDSVEEMQVLTADYSAEYGTASGAEIRIVTKSGTRDFHGGMYEYLRNSAAIANTYSRNENPATRFTTPFRYNDFGFFVGGPAWIPKSTFLSKTRDKVFFFIGEDWIRLRQFSTFGQAVPTNLMRQGDFSELLSPNPWYPTGTLLKDPASCYTSGSYNATNCTTYMAETGKNAIPGYVGSTADLNDDGGFTGAGATLPNSPNGYAFVNAYAPATPGYLSGTSNEEGALENPNNQRNGQYNLDILLTPNQHLEFRRSDLSYNQYAPANGVTNLVPLAWQRPNQSNALGWEWTIKPTMINEARITETSYEYYIASAAPTPLLPLQKIDNGYNRTAFGFNFAYLYPISAQPKGMNGDPIPNKIPNGTVPTFSSIQGTAYPSYATGIIYGLSDSFTDIWGNHTLKFGFYGNDLGENDNDQINVATVPGGASNQSGTFTMSNDWTGVGLANEMLGLSDQYNEIGQKAYTDWKIWMWEGFAQDNWQVTPKLHLDYGLRWTVAIAPHALWGNSDYFDPGSYNAAKAPVVNPTTGLINTATSTTPFDGMVIPGYSAFPSSAAQHYVLPAKQSNWTNADAVLASCENEPCSDLFAPGMKKGYTNTTSELQPRFGFAYQLTPASVIRGGAGRFSQHKGIIDNMFPGGNSPFQPTTTVTSARDNAAGTGPFQQIDNPGASILATEVPPLTVTTFNQKIAPPSRYAWNLSYQQQFNAIHSTLNLAYVGAVGNHNWQVVDINQPAAGAAEANPTVKIDALRPYAGYTEIQQEQSVVNEKYKGLQIAWSSHFPDGSSLGIAYSGATTHDGGSSYRDIEPNAYNNKNLWGQSDYNIRSALLLNYNYILPFFKGRHDAAGELLGGWEISGADQFQTGTPSSVVGSGDYAGISQGGGIVNANGNATGTADGSMSNGGEFWAHSSIPGLTKGYSGPSATGPQWFAGCAPGNASSCGGATNVQFTAPTAGTFVTQPGVRNLINNPGIEDWNLSAIKTFAINESNAFEFHGDVYDVWNHANLAGANFNATSSQFGKITGKSGLVRTIQVGLKYRF
jgi:hypothetical protein